MSLLSDIQDVTRPELDDIFAELEMTIQVRRSAAGGGSAPPDFDPSGAVVPGQSGSPPSTTPDGSFPGYAYQIPSSERAKYGDLGAQLGIPLWLVLVHWTADLNVPGLTLVASGGALPGPITLTPAEDAVDLGTVGVCWQVLCRAPGALGGA